MAENGKPKNARFDMGSAAVGAIIAIGVMVAIFVSLGPAPFRFEAICEPSESPIVCGRNWFNLLAVIAGAGTIYFLYRGQQEERAARADQERWQREQGALERSSYTTEFHKAMSPLRSARLAGGRIEKFVAQAGEGADHRWLARRVCWELRHIRRFVEKEEISAIRRRDAQIDSLASDVLYLLDNIRTLYKIEDLSPHKLHAADDFQFPDNVTAEDFLDSIDLSELAETVRQLKRRADTVATALVTFTLAETNGEPAPFSIVRAVS